MRSSDNQGLPLEGGDMASEEGTQPLAAPEWVCLSISGK
jgi:hypothetical protein